MTNAAEHLRPRFGLIADDLTGALDAGAGFACHGLRAILPFSGQPEDASDADVLLLNTETRDEPDAAVARRRAREAAERLKQAGIGCVYKKIDSVLRGHPGPELAGVLDVYGGRALVAPAFPAQGRTTVGGRQLVGGRPVEPYGGDLRTAFGEATDRCDIRDAATDEDLAKIARDGATGHDLVWCGTAGLAAHVSEALDLRPISGEPPVPSPVERVVVLAGTWHPATAVQIDWLRDQPLPSVDVQVNGRQHSSPAEVVAALQAAARRLTLDGSIGLILTGGETALIVCRELGATSIEVVGEAVPGIPLGILQLAGRQVAVATKSGGFGGPDALGRTAEALLKGG